MTYYALGCMKGRSKIQGRCYQNFYKFESKLDRGKGTSISHSSRLCFECLLPLMSIESTFIESNGMSTRFLYEKLMSVLLQHDTT